MRLECKSDSIGYCPHHKHLLTLSFFSFLIFHALDDAADFFDNAIAQQNFNVHFLD